MNKHTPFQEVYHASNRVRSGVALGGLGAGSLELRKDGGFYNWRIANNWPYGSGPELQMSGERRAHGYEESDSYLFFIVRYQEEGKPPVLKILRLNNGKNLGGINHYDPIYIFPWLTPVEQITFSARFPFAWLEFEDPALPLKMRMEAVSPFIPHDAENSALPGAFFNFEIESRSTAPADVTIIGSLRNLVGYDTPEKYFVTEPFDAAGFRGVQMTAGMDERWSSYGQMTLASLSPESTFYAGWGHLHPYYEWVLRNRHLPDVDDTNGKAAFLKEHPERTERELEWLIEASRNRVDPETGKRVAAAKNTHGQQKLYSSLAHSTRLEPGSRWEHGFALSWFFPNNYATDDANARITAGEPLPENYGHEYVNRFSNSREVAEHLVKHRNDLLGRTRQFTDDFYTSDADTTLLDLVNAQLNTLITNSTWLADGQFGLCDDSGLLKRTGSRHGGFNPDLSVYCSGMAQTLFPELHKRAERDGLERRTENLELGKVRSDHPGDWVQILMRGVLWRDDVEYLREIWPAIRRLIAFGLDELDQDGDGVPDIGGRNNHCSYDNLPMYGLASYVGLQWLSALTAAMAGARMLGDAEAENQYRDAREKAARSVEEHLWTGSYYRLTADPRGDRTPNDGCLTDQLLGQWTAHLVNLERIVDPEKTRSALREIWQRNYLHDSMLINCSYPEDDPVTGLGPIKPGIWIDQSSTPWSGVELAFASFLLYEGQLKESLQLLRAIERRHRDAGLYWDHEEACGRYYRSCSAWMLLNGVLRLSYGQGHFSFDPLIAEDRFTLFFATPGGTAHYVRDGGVVEIRVRTGTLTLRSVRPAGLNPREARVDGQEAACEIERDTLRFRKQITLRAGQNLSISLG